MKKYLLFIAIIFLCSCGARKSAVDINKSKEDVKEQTKTEVREQSTSDQTKTTSEENKNDIVDEKQEQRITELYNENGSLKSRITELLNSKKTDKSGNIKKGSETLKTYQTRKINSETQNTRTITKYVKVKATEQSNKNIYFTIFGVLSFLIAAYFLYGYFKK